MKTSRNRPIKIDEEELLQVVRAAIAQINSTEERSINAPTGAISSIHELKNILREERKKQKLTREILAKLAGVSIGTVAAVETGKETISLYNLQKILNVLGKKLWIK